MKHQVGETAAQERRSIPPGAVRLLSQHGGSDALSEGISGRGRTATRRGGQKPALRIVRGIFAALTDPAGVIAHRAGALERVLSGLVASIPGMSVVGAAAILAETGDPTRFATARALVEHAGLAPREKTSGAFTGRTRAVTRRRPPPPCLGGRPSLVWHSAGMIAAACHAAEHLAGRRFPRRLPGRCGRVGGAGGSGSVQGDEVGVDRGGGDVPRGGAA